MAPINCATARFSGLGMGELHNFHFNNSGSFRGSCGKLAAYVVFLAHRIETSLVFYESKLIQRELLKTRELTQHCTLQDVLAKLIKPNGVKYQMQYVK